ncbi:MAG TPA: HAMP domain-containing sensor histidine kinase [Cyclobacteriaceae bacterium]|jgi:signal transduction histidine kinase|nr:HAMP domain-containing sensor histidine kinase [Cyclobacteriaceae bacterium]
MLEILLIGLNLLVLIVLLRALVKTRKQAMLMKLQSQEIQKQIKELEQRNDDLQKLNQEKVQLISLVSHDLKGPFNRIFALTQLMNSSSENFSKEQKEYLGKIHQIAVDGLGMVRNILDSRKLDDKVVEPNQVEFDLSIFVSSIVKNYQTLAEKKKIEMVFEQGGPILIKADKLYLGRAIENLLSNAVKFSPENKKIFVCLGSSSQSIEFSVKDEGPGISNEDQLKLFQRFQQLTAQPTGGESSSGLGLFIVKTIVDKMGGEVLCESEIGHGAKFILRLPSKIP